MTKPSKANQQYQGYSAHITDAEALTAFEIKFSRQPDELIRTGGGVNVGPLRQEETSGKNNTGEAGGSRFCGFS